MQSFTIEVTTSSKPCLSQAMSESDCQHLCAGVLDLFCLPASRRLSPTHDFENRSENSTHHHDFGYGDSGVHNGTTHQAAPFCEELHFHAWLKTEFVRPFAYADNWSWMSTRQRCHFAAYQQSPAAYKCDEVIH